jgi:FKBP-type peptidyl-prolyl cis-trans isomerase
MRMRAYAVAVLGFAALVAPVLASPPPLGEGANSAFLAANAKKPGVVTMPGIQYRVIKAGNGAQPDRSDCVTVDYKGSLISGKVFDATKPGEHATFPAGRLIAGWTEALQLMHEGEEWELVIPAGLAYGKNGAGGVIPGGQTLVFDLTLLKVSKSIQGQCG